MLACRRPYLPPIAASAARAISENTRTQYQGESVRGDFGFRISDCGLFKDAGLILRYRCTDPRWVRASRAREVDRPAATIFELAPIRLPLIRSQHCRAS